MSLFLFQAGGLGSAVTTHVQTPGTQTTIDLVGNPNLKAETGNSYTLGVVWAPKLTGFFEGIRTSVDFYSIKVKDAITVADTNEYIADCYNFYGNNPGYSPNYSSGSRREESPYGSAKFRSTSASS